MVEVHRGLEAGLGAAEALAAACTAMAELDDPMADASSSSVCFGAG